MLYYPRVIKEKNYSRFILDIESIQANFEVKSNFSIRIESSMI